MKKTGRSFDQLLCVVRGYYAPIRKLPEVEARKQLLLELPRIAAQYGAREAIEQFIIIECVRLVLKKFACLGIVEIGEAYRMWAAGEIHAAGGEMYGGAFNAAQLGKVLAAYREQRRANLAAYLKARDAELEKEESLQSAQIQRRQFEERFPALIEEARERDATWQQVPEYWYEACRKRGWIEFEKGEARAIYAEAKTLAEKELRAQAQDAPMLEKRRLIKALTLQDDSFEGKARAIARKIAVFRKVLNHSL